jgi:hypothetical protein
MARVGIGGKANVLGVAGVLQGGNKTPPKGKTGLGTPPPAAGQKQQ